MNRDPFLLKFRPELSLATITEDMTAEEKFQTLTLRPLIEFQRDLILATFKNYIGKHKNVFYEYNVEKRLEYIANALQKDIKFRNVLKGMVIGLFTSEEYSTYISNSSALNKRIMNLVKDHLQENIQLLEFA